MKNALQTAGLVLFLFFFSLASFNGCSSPMGKADVDSDQDTIVDSRDNCPNLANPSQTDEDGDGIGDLCEAIIGCGDSICDPEAGECDVFRYCLKDCTRSKCFGLSGNSTCGDGLCDPLAGECSDFGPCIKDCPDPDHCSLFPTGSCGNGRCDPWEDNPDEVQSFCPPDCACQLNLVEGDCQTILDCAGTPGTVCRPSSFPQDATSQEDYNQKILSIACICSKCGNGALEPEEGCDDSAGENGNVSECFASGGSCNFNTCECVGGGPCPNRRLDPGEECDTGFSEFPQQGDCPSGFICNANRCSCSQCGNQAVDSGEQCDTGGVLGPSLDCEAIEPDLICRGSECSCTTCGNGQVDVGEDCDVNSFPSTWASNCLDPFCPDNCLCPPAGESACDNCMDDDDDLMVDCLDSDCAANFFCSSTGEEMCRGCVDDDGDGLVDCADPDCSSKPSCAPESSCFCQETSCGDLIDNEGDGLTDCADTTDCCPDPACSSEPACLI